MPELPPVTTATRPDNENSSSRYPVTSHNVTVLTDTFLEAAATSADFIHSPAVLAAWDQPSALPRMSVRALAAHLGRQVFLTADVLRASEGEPPVLTLLEHYQRVAWIGKDVDDPVNVETREGAEKLATAGAAALADRVRKATEEIRTAFTSPDRTVWLPWTGWSLTLDDYLSTRLLEIVIHSDDLVVSVGVEGPVLPEAATDATLVLLTRLAARRHGVAPVLRALSRHERAPEAINAFLPVSWTGAAAGMPRRGPRQ
jgi:hypothetical protein